MWQAFYCLLINQRLTNEFYEQARLPDKHLGLYKRTLVCGQFKICRRLMGRNLIKIFDNK